MFGQKKHTKTFLHRVLLLGAMLLCVVLVDNYCFKLDDTLLSKIEELAKENNKQAQSQHKLVDFYTFNSVSSSKAGRTDYKLQTKFLRFAQLNLIMPSLHKQQALSCRDAQAFKLPRFFDRIAFLRFTHQHQFSADEDGGSLA